MYGHDFYASNMRHKAALAASKPQDARARGHTAEEQAAIDRWLAQHPVTRCPTLLMDEAAYLDLQQRAGALLQQERNARLGVAAPVGPASPHLTDKQAIIAREWPLGTPLSVIAQMVGAAKSTVSGMARDMGLPKRVGKPRPNIDREAIVAREWPLGTPKARIAELCDCSEANISAIVNKLDLPRRPHGGLCRAKNI